jgi:thymidylate synthase (FAD)
MPATRPVVKLVRYTPAPEELVAAAAKLCYAADASKILEQEGDKATKFVEMLAKMGHMSPIEHASFTFYLEGVSRAMTHQLVRHRIASYSQRSQRYVKHADFEYVIPPSLQGKTVSADGKSVDAAAYFEETMSYIGERYRKLVEALGDTGESTNEDARYVLPNSCETKIFVTMNARELLHFFNERLCNRAQWEIRQVADLMLTEAKKVAPGLFARSGSKCVALGHCPEGKMSCGRFEDMVEKYAGKKAKKKAD